MSIALLYRTRTIGINVAWYVSWLSVLSVAENVGMEPRSNLVLGRFRETSRPPAWTRTLLPGT